MFAVQPSAVVLMTGAVLPVDWVKTTPPAPMVAAYLTESAKYASSAVTRLRRSDFIEARYAFSFVLANFGIAIAAKMPMITTTIRSSIRVKPLRFIWTTSPCKIETANDSVPSGESARIVPSSEFDIANRYRPIIYIIRTVAESPPQKHWQVALFASRHAGRNDSVIV